MRTRRGGSASPSAPALEETNCHRSFRSRACPWLSARGSAQPGSAEGWLRSGGSAPGPAPLGPTATSLSFPLRKQGGLRGQTPACDTSCNETGSACAFPARCKQLMFPTAWPFIVPNLHICILNKTAPGRSPRLSNEIFHPSDIPHPQWLTCFLDCIIYCG